METLAAVLDIATKAIELIAALIGLWRESRKSPDRERSED